MTPSAEFVDVPQLDDVRALGLAQAAPGPIAVLLLEDSGFDAEALTRDCDRTDLPVEVTLVNGLQAFAEVITRRLFDLVILDYMLPDGDGLMARDLLRRTPRNAEVPAVLITGEARPDVARAALARGCFDYLPKDGIDADILRDLILRATSPMALRGGTLREETLAAMQDYLRGERATAEERSDPGRMRAALSALSVAGGGKAVSDWLVLLNEVAPSGHAPGTRH
ncbi:response regulator [Pseudooceanicola sp. LIPI14-2-Ac024]|uniref:response regulator n=1 Tax=Pseudooceanicola sp. LIPI14-2-Ac024 TaxID=3344875 RepID=UPI0035D13449